MVLCSGTVLQYTNQTSTYPRRHTHLVAHICKIKLFYFFVRSRSSSPTMWCVGGRPAAAAGFAAAAAAGGAAPATGATAPHHALRLLICPSRDTLVQGTVGACVHCLLANPARTPMSWVHGGCSWSPTCRPRSSRHRHYSCPASETAGCGCSAGTLVPVEATVNIPTQHLVPRPGSHCLQLPMPSRGNAADGWRPRSGLHGVRLASHAQHPGGGGPPGLLGRPGVRGQPTPEDQLDHVGEAGQVRGSHSRSSQQTRRPPPPGC